MKSPLFIIYLSELRVLLKGLWRHNIQLRYCIMQLFVQTAQAVQPGTQEADQVMLDDGVIYNPDAGTKPGFRNRVS